LFLRAKVLAIDTISRTPTTEIKMALVPYSYATTAKSNLLLDCETKRLHTHRNL
jgi:hypothetical protein